jgi:hypothetical protein
LASGKNPFAKQNLAESRPTSHHESEIGLSRFR